MHIRFTYTALLLSQILFTFTLKAQDKVVDSLKLVLKNAQYDSVRIKALAQLSEVCAVEDILKYAEPCVKLSETNAAKAPTSLLKKFYLTYLAESLNNIGFLADQEGNMYKAMDFYSKSLKIKEEIGDKPGIAESLNNIGLIHTNQGNIPKALEYYHKSLKIREEINDKKGIANSLTNIGIIYYKQNDIQKSLEYYTRGLKIREQINDEKGISASLNNIGYLYQHKGNIEKALEYYDRSLTIRKKIKDKRGIAITAINIGDIYRQTNHKKALDYYLKALDIQKEINDKQGITFSTNSISNLMLETGNVGEAYSYAKQNLQTSKEIGFPESIARAAATLKKIYQKQNNFKEALSMYTLEMQMRDSINNEETKKASVKKQFQYEYEKQAAADSVKNAEKQKVKNAQLSSQQAQLKQEKTTRYVLYGGLILVIAFSAFVFNRFRLTQKQKAVIEDQKILVDKAYEHLHEKNKEVMDSIRYANRIQRALITNEKYIERSLNKLRKN